MFDFAFGGFALGCFDADFFRLISANSAAIPETVEQPLLRKIVWVEQSFTDRDKADKKFSCCSFFALIRRQWFMDSRAFHDGIRPGIINVKIGLDKALGGFWESAQDFIAGHLIVFNLPAAVSHATAGVVSPQVLTLQSAKI
jgi:hypothetical protein